MIKNSWEGYVVIILTASSYWYLCRNLKVICCWNRNPMSSFSELSLKYSINLALLNPQPHSNLYCSSKHACLPSSSGCLPLYLVLPYWSHLLYGFEQVASCWSFIQKLLGCDYGSISVYVVFKILYSLTWFMVSAELRFNSAIYLHLKASR